MKRSFVSFRRDRTSSAMMMPQMDRIERPAEDPVRADVAY